MKILVIDDAPEILFLLSSYLTGQGHEVVTAQDGEKALAVYRVARPDLIIMDVLMPVMNGYAASTEIRRIDAEQNRQWVPIIFLSAQADDDERNKGFEAGGDDFMAKPVNFKILDNKIRALRRIAVMQDLNARYAEALQNNLEKNRAEQELARHLLDHIVRQDEAYVDIVTTWVSPAEHFSGDVVMTARSPTNQLNILLADATGHGLAAAIGVLPVIESFYSMSEKEFSIASIGRELNRKVKNLLPTDRFIVAVLVSIDFVEQSISVWNGGAPEVVFVADSGEVQRVWKSAHPPLGVMSDAAFESQAQVFQWTESGELLLCSDGLPEAEDTLGMQFGMTRFLSLLARPYGTGRFKVITDAVKTHIQNAPQRDDISLISIRCAERLDWVPMIAAIANTQDNLPSGQSRWHLSLSLGAEELKYLDALPVLMSWLDHLKISTAHRGQAFLVLGELFNNALDHGILELDSKLKQERDGFAQYIDLRAARLGALNHATIEIDLDRITLAGHDHLRVQIKDSGAGFDHVALLDRHQSSNAQLSGRGIRLVKQLCQSLEYAEDGKTVCAVYLLD